MLKTCTRCGVVEENHICPNKPQRKKMNYEGFRGSRAWRYKSLEIRERDHYLCKVCLSNKYETVDILNYKNLSVHHIVPLAENYDKRLDNDNLITLCPYHHKLAEEGKISKEELFELIEEES